MRILLVEDDKNLVEALTTLLSKHNYLLDVATDGKLGWDMAHVIDYDLVLLDVGLPKLDGITLCRRLRQQDQNLPILLMTVRDSVNDKLIGLDNGADDYLVKPFDLREFLARVRVLGRRSSERSPAILSCGTIRLDPQMREITCNDQIIPLSRKEYLLIELFLRHPHRVFSRSDIVDHLWTLDSLPAEDTVKSHIRRVRRKLSEFGVEDFIETLYGQGYRVNPALLKPVTPDAEQTSAQMEELDEAIAQLWNNIQAGVFQRVAVLEQAVVTLQAGYTFEPHRLATAQQNAHQLAGMVGTCGFDVASQIARAIEMLLQQPLQSRGIYSLAQLVATLRWDLETPRAQETLATDLID
ncbi:MAG: response regulator transcription factor [Elainellaceae cyanobacterium]